MMHTVLVKQMTISEKETHRISLAEEHGDKSNIRQSRLGEKIRSEMSLKFHRAGKEATLYLGRSTLKGKEARKLWPLGKP